MGESKARIEIVVGDARLSLEREAPQAFDVLAVDAFSGDSVPVHLITSEAMNVYLRHLEENGIIAFHVTNRFLWLPPVVEEIARAKGLHAVLIHDDAEGTDLRLTDWMLVARNPVVLDKPGIREAVTALAPIPGLRAWTDDFNNLFQILK
jgi:spermidine synthase